jgi:hypothetical protein
MSLAGSANGTPLSQRTSGDRNNNMQAVQLLHTETASFETDRGTKPAPFQPQQEQQPAPTQIPAVPVASQMCASLDDIATVVKRKVCEKVIPLRLLFTAQDVPTDKSHFVGSGNVTCLSWPTGPDDETNTELLKELFAYEGEDGQVIVPRDDNLLLEEICLELHNTSDVALAANGSHFENKFKHVTEHNRCETHAGVFFAGEKKKHRVFLNKDIKEVAQHSSFPSKKELEVQEHHLPGYSEFRVNAESAVLEHIARADPNGRYIDNVKRQRIRELRDPGRENGTVLIDKKMYMEMRDKLIDSAKNASQYYTDIRDLRIELTRMDGRKFAAPPAEYDCIADEDVRAEKMKAFAAQVSPINARLYVRYHIDP